MKFSPQPVQGLRYEAKATTGMTLQMEDLTRTSDRLGSPRRLHGNGLDNSRVAEHDIFVQLMFFIRAMGRAFGTLIAWGFGQRPQVPIAMHRGVKADRTISTGDPNTLSKCKQL